MVLGGRRLIMANNNQPKVGGSGRLDVIGERVGVGSVGGLRSAIVWGGE